MRVTLASPVVAAEIHRILGHLDLWQLLAGKRLLLTGSTGFFGQWLLATLARLNHDGAAIEVMAVSRSPEVFLHKYPEYADARWISWLKSDVQDVMEIPPGRTFDMVLHAATDTLAGGQADPLRIYDTVLNGARNALDAAVRTGARRVLFTGTGAQYGALDYGVPVPETGKGACDSLLVGSAYAEAKRAQETLAAIYGERYGLEIVSTRCFAFSGPGLSLNEHFAIGNFVRDALWHDELVLKSSGTAVRSYLHGADLAGWLLTLLARGDAANAYNVGSDKALTIAELAHRVVARIAPGKCVRILGQDHAAQARSYYVPDIQKARGLGLDDWTSLDHSIDSMAQWVREAGGQHK
ncbi:NAD(P)-dependent oxidoreductase [Pseudomonas sp. 14P_8.1_Bac3]|uniref:NAD-dependent epimerase/dehydratase family protein n=1 Tax=Pseudomonas sp. 14P_8.1_Bac3 TaxID=2971621 RepID=UPI0021C9055C|nr:NAD(P)-dependent oxidoreductase [Pseudomonas sp. 14P_8.1_Bac3]MCU1759163.1 NAD(P)-dependent oxidoreductase [Pseudomonas sp. 14P_8.1_Bac3]